MSFRIQINLKSFFKDYRQKAFISIDENWKSVKDLQDHIIKLFKLPSKVYLTTHCGILIPHRESISVVSPNDVFIVHAEVDQVEDSEVASPIPENQNESDLDAILTGTKRKRKRKRSKKQSTTNAVSFEEVEEKLDHIFKPLTDYHHSSPEKNKKSKHIRFSAKDSESTDLTEDNIEPETRIPNKTEKDSLIEKIISTQPLAVRAIEIEEIESGNFLVKFNDTIQPKEKDFIENDKNKQEYILKEEKLVENDDNIKNNIKKQSRLPNNFAMEEIRKNVDNLNLNTLTEIPKENDLIVFKYLKMDLNYMPTLSEYIVGMIESIDEENQNLKIYILAGNEETKKPTGKFSVDDDDEFNDQDETGTLVLNWKSLLEAKILKL